MWHPKVHAHPGHPHPHTHILPIWPRISLLPTVGNKKHAACVTLYVAVCLSPCHTLFGRFCKNGEWTTVRVDDYFPCAPCGGPVYSKVRVPCTMCASTKGTFFS